MNPLRLKLKNCRTFEQLDFEFPTGLAVIVGENGAGKSTIVNGVDIGLFAGRGELAPLLTDGMDELELELTFEHASETYRVRRQFRKGKTTLDFEQHLPGATGFGGAQEKWIGLTRESAEQTQQLIEEILGLSRTTYRASSSLRQGDGGAFTEAAPRDRRDILAEILALILWDKWHTRVRAWLREAEDQLVAIRTRMETAEMNVADKALTENALKESAATVEMSSGTVKLLEGQLEREQAALAGNAAAVERLHSCEVQLETAKADEHRAKAAVTEVNAAIGERTWKQAEISELATAAGQVEPLEAKLTEARTQGALAAAALAARATATAEADRVALALSTRERETETRRQNALELDGKAATLRDAPDITDLCPECEQHLGAESRAKLIASYMTKAAAIMAELEAEIPDLIKLRAHAAEARTAADSVNVPEVVDLAPMERELALARQAAERRAILLAQVELLGEKASQLATCEEALVQAANVTLGKQAVAEQARAAVGDTQGLEAAVEQCRRDITRIRTELETSQAKVARHTAELEQIQKAEAEIKDLTVERERLFTEINKLKLAERAFGRDGIPALLVESLAVPQIEMEANRILAELGTSYTVELRTQTVTKTTDTLKETLDIIIHNGSGYERPYETYSEGEKTRLNLALRIALARLLTHRGAQSGNLVIDEPEFLSENGITRLVDVLHGLTGEFSGIQLVTHHPAGTASVDQQIHVVKDGDRSRIATPGQERIPA